MDPQIWQAAAAVAVPALGLMGGLLSRDRAPGMYRKLRHATAAIRDLPADAQEARGALEGVIVQQATAIRDREAHALTRRLNVTNVVLSVILTLFVAALMLPLISWVTSVWGTGFIWLVGPAGVILMLFGALLVGAAWATIFSPPKPRKP